MQEKKENSAIVCLRRIVIFGKLVESGLKLVFLGPFWKDHVITIFIFFSVVSNLVTWMFLINNKIEGNYPVILHYNLAFGVDYLGNFSRVYLIPFTGLVVFIFNTLLGYHVYTKEKLASYFLQFNALITQAFLMFASYLIIKVNS